jgi:hypothetical protein
VLVVGVYPSAFHVAWSPPGHTGRPLISSLAVDVEPIVFWDGTDPTPSQVFGRWLLDVSFDPERHGSAYPGHNGPSGAGLVDEILTPLGLDPMQVAFTDAVPWFFTKRGRGSQGAAIADRFLPVAGHLGVNPGSLPTRPSTKELPKIAAGDKRRDSFRAELLEADAPLIVTLGQEAVDSVGAIADDSTGLPRRLAPQGYGRRGALTIEGHRFEVLPLAHPGFLRQTNAPAWREAFDGWKRSSNKLGR